VREAFASRPTTLPDYVAILRRRKWVIAGVPVIAAVCAYLVAQGQSPQYRATSKVLVNRATIVSSVTAVDPTSYDPVRYLATQADVARSPELADRVAAAAGIKGVTGGLVLDESNVTPDTNADLLDFAVTAPDADQATTLANAYAQQYTRFKTQLDTQKIDIALRTLHLQMAAMRAQSGTGSQGYASLQQQDSQLQTARTLLADNTSVLQPADGASKVRPRPTHTALLGLLLGAVLGIGLALLVEALDRRVRSEEEIENTLGIPLLGRIPPPPRHLRNANGLVMLSQPGDVHAEAFRKLKTSIEFLNLEHGARTIMVTSAVPREGKTTTIANLAVAFARSGRKVALVDLDLRQPSIHPFFSTDTGAGISDVLAGVETLEGALRPRFLPSTTQFTASRNGSQRKQASERSLDRSTLTILAAGSLAPASGDRLADLLESESVGGLLAELGTRFEIVLTDTPPVLAVGDAMPLTSHVDAVLIVLHARIRRPVLEELARELQKSQAPILGFVLTGVEEGDTYGVYGYGYTTPERPRSKQPARSR
jgi:succinoglycan biosynthesis transport protein ExoP